MDEEELEQDFSEELELEDDLFEDEVEEIEEESSEESIEEEEGEETESTPSTEDEEEDFKDKKSLLNALNKERKLRKEAEKKAKQKANEEKLKSAYDSLIESGVDESIAKTISELTEKPMKELSDLKFQNAILNLSKQSEFSDIEDYKDDIKPLVDKGLTIEQSYYALTGANKKVKTRTTEAEMQRQIEAKVLNQAKRNKALDIDTNGSAGKATSTQKPQYTALEQKIAKASGMSVEEYMAYKNINSASDYQTYAKKKK